MVPAMWYLVGVESSLDPIEADNAILQVDRHWHPICQTLVSIATDTSV